MRSWFVEVWSEAYLLRKDGLDDPRLVILDDVAKRFNLTVSLTDTDNVIELRPADSNFDQYELMDVLLSTPEVRRFFEDKSKYNPLNCFNANFGGLTATQLLESGKGTAEQIQAAKYEYWMNEKPMKEVTYARTVNRLVELHKKLEDQAGDKAGPSTPKIH